MGGGSLKESWIALASKYTEIDSAEKWFILLEKKYRGTQRYYHNFNHLEAMFKGLFSIQEQIQDIEIIQFAIWFHDIIYNSYKKNNEQKSAEEAVKFLSLSSFPKEKIDKVAVYINATQKHELLVGDSDLATFLDLDLSILGVGREQYEEYAKKIRKEYQLIPYPIYKKGRRKVLQQFIQRETLFFTPTFQQLYETQARENLAWEIDLLA